MAIHRRHLLPLLLALVSLVLTAACDLIYDEDSCEPEASSRLRHCRLIVHSSGSMTLDSVFLDYNTRALIRQIEQYKERTITRSSASFGSSHSSTAPFSSASAIPASGSPLASGRRGLLTANYASTEDSLALQADYDLCKRYIMHVYKPGDYKKTLYEFTWYSTDFLSKELSEEFDYDFAEQDYDIYIWSDFVRESTHENLYYNPTDFSDVIMLPPTGQTNYSRSCFAGFTDVNFIASADSIDINLYLGRPVGSYTIIVENLSNLIRGINPGEDISQYRIQTVYPRYLPSAVDLFTGNIVGTLSGGMEVSFESEIYPVGNDRAILSFDYVLLSTSASAGVDLQLYLVDPSGTRYALSGVLSIPMKRDQNTYVFGEFTQPAQGGIGINYNFSGEYVIYI